MPKSLQAEVAEACASIFLNVQAMDRLKERPELLGYWVKQLCPAATEDHITRGMDIAAELILADLAEMKDEFQRGTLVLPETAFAET
jgi:hypothetical protein